MKNNEWNKIVGAHCRTVGSGRMATANGGELRGGAAGELAEGRGHHCDQAAWHDVHGRKLFGGGEPGVTAWVGKELATLQ